MFYFPFLLKSLRRARSLVLCSVILTGCSFPQATKSPQQIYDFGPIATSSAPVQVQKRTWAVVFHSTEALAPLDTTAVTYRLGYSAANQPMAYANSRWAATPAELLNREIRAQLAQQASIVSASERQQDLVLEAELEEFSQVFDSPERSHGLIALRATLSRAGHLVGQRTFVTQEPAPTADAAGGVTALTLAARATVASLAGWIGEMVP